MKKIAFYLFVALCSFALLVLVTSCNQHGEPKAAARGPRPAGGCWPDENNCYSYDAEGGCCAENNWCSRFGCSFHGKPEWYRDLPNPFGAPPDGGGSPTKVREDGALIASTGIIGSDGQEEFYTARMH